MKVGEAVQPQRSSIKELRFHENAESMEAKWPREFVT